MPGRDGGGSATGGGGTLSVPGKTTPVVDLASALSALANSGSYDGDGESSESRNTIAIGRGIDAGPLPPGAGGVEHDAFFAHRVFPRPDPVPHPDPVADF